MPRSEEIRSRLMQPGDLEPAIAAIRDGGWGERRAEQDGDVVGTTIVTLSAGIGWLGLVFAAPRLRGQGLGSRLTRTRLDSLRDRVRPGGLPCAGAHRAAAAISEAGFEQRAVLPRMRLGEPVEWQPAKIWALVGASFG